MSAFSILDKGSLPRAWNFVSKASISASTVAWRSESFPVKNS